MSAARALAAAGLAALLGGCATLDYYAQSVTGHLGLMLRTRPIETLLADPAIDEGLRARLERARAVRDFASRELGLPDNGSYRGFAEIGRRYVVWTVVAAPELDLEPRTWCFPVVGCVAYRGYYDEAAARAFADGLRREGLDVHVRGVRAYSTLGWFDDPLLDTMIALPEPWLAGIVFHELAHQRLYVADDTSFNESFAVAVERAGVRRWLAHAGDPRHVAAYERTLESRAEFTALVREARADLARIYASERGDAGKRAAKAQRLERLRRDYRTAAAGRDPAERFDRWFDDELNNAKLALFATYDEWVPALERLLARAGGDLEALYAACEALGERPAAERRAALEALDAARDSSPRR